MTDQAKLIQRIQAAGWVLESADKDTCVAKCPAMGCEMRAVFRTGGPLPKREPHSGPDLDIPVSTFNGAREVLRDRRRELLLTIRDVEEAAGAADDHLAKIERDNYDKIPNVETFMMWAEALGFQVVLRPIPLPPITVRAIVDTRAQSGSRARRFQLENQRSGRPNRSGGR